MSAAPIPHDPALMLEYEQVNQNFRMLAEIRFKLLAFLPTLAGVAIYALSHMAMSTDTAPPNSEKALYDLGTALLISALGFLATFGITLYDQRNTALYNALIVRAKAIEALMGIADGQFRQRPPRGRRVLGCVAGHDTALALIYSPVLGGWFFPMAYSALRWGGVTHVCRLPLLQISLLLALAMALLFLEELFRLDGVWTNVWKKFSLARGMANTEPPA